MKFLDSILAIFTVLGTPLAPTLPARPIEFPRPISPASFQEAFRNAVAEVGSVMRSEIEELKSQKTDV